MIVAHRNYQLAQGHDLDSDKANDNGELSSVAAFLINPERFRSAYPSWWPEADRKNYEALSEIERYVVAGAFLSARIDQMKYDQILSNGKSSELE